MEEPSYSTDPLKNMLVACHILMRLLCAKHFAVEEKDSVAEIYNAELTLSTATMMFAACYGIPSDTLSEHIYTAAGIKLITNLGPDALDRVEQEVRLARAVNTVLKQAQRNAENN